MDGKVRPDVQQGFDLLWVQVTTSAECKKVTGYSLFREGATNAAGKEPIEANQPIKTDEHSFLNKINL
jgi:hypothetical protein